MKIIQVKVKPNSKEQKIEEQEDGSLIVQIKSPPVDGRANAELTKLLSKEFNVPKSYISIQSGLTSKHKLVQILAAD